MAVTHAEGTATEHPRRPWVMWVRLLVSFGLLTILISRIHLDTMLPKHRHLSTLLWLMAGIVVTLFGFVLSAWRWQRVLLVFHARVRLRVLTSHYLAGLFLGNVLPSTIGGDVLRITRVTKNTGSSAIAFASVALERLTGWVALPLLVFLGFALEPSLLNKNHEWIALVIAASTLLLLIAVLAIAAGPRLAGRFKEHENWMRFIGSVHLGVDELRRQPRLAGGVLVAALLYQASVVVALYCAVQALDMSIPIAAVIAFIPAVAIAQVMPLSIGGLGVREGMLVLFLGPLGVSTGRAVGLGLLWYGMTLLVSLIGAPSFAVGHRHKRHPSMDAPDT